MLVFLALGDAKMLSFALGDAKVRAARYFAFWWNIGFTLGWLKVMFFFIMFLKAIRIHVYGSS